MTDSRIQTAEEFAETRHLLPENGRWVELVEGRVVNLDPPDAVHGNVVLNLAKALAAHLQLSNEDDGYLCFEQGMLVSRDPDTVRFPAVCYLKSPERFAQVDQMYTDRPVSLVVEIASTKIRRRNLVEKVRAYHNWGVELVWTADCVEKELHVMQRGQKTKSYRAHQSLFGGPVLSGFKIGVGALFADPEWWR